MAELAKGECGGFAAHPKGLAYLAFTELWERFSYYGMTALLALYLIKHLLLPGHAEHVLGLASLRHVFEFRGPISDQAFASLLYGWYGGLVYFTPTLGGLIADRWLGTKRTVVLGALLMSIGHLAMAFDGSFLIALALLILGSGCLKGNISAQVGALYPAAAQSLRARGFTIFSIGINIGSVIGPLATGGVVAIYGWHAGFVLAAVLMLIALAIYLAGQHHLPEVEVRRKGRSALPPLTREEKRATWALIGLIVLTIPANIAFPMIWNVGLIWIDQRVDLHSPFGTPPASWFYSLDSFASIAVAAPLVALWAWQARRGNEPDGIMKIGIGAMMVGISASLLAFGSVDADANGRVSIIWALAGFIGMGIAAMWYWPILLAMISQAAPSKVNSTLMGGAFLSLFIGLITMGWVGSFYDQMSDAAFWTVDAAIAFGGALLVFLAHKPLKRLLEPTMKIGVSGQI
jgi:proton-dependent oligopeptide transporter, POT family